MKIRKIVHSAQAGIANTRQVATKLGGACQKSALFFGDFYEWHGGKGHVIVVP